MNDKTPPKRITITPEEMSEFEKIKLLAHYDPKMERNTFGEYVSQLGKWTAQIRKKYKIDDESSFFFK